MHRNATDGAPGHQRAALPARPWSGATLAELEQYIAYLRPRRLRPMQGWLPSAGCLCGSEVVEELGHVLMVQVQHDAPRLVVFAQDEGRAQTDRVTGRLVAHSQIP